MQRKSRFGVLSVVLIALALAIGPANANRIPVEQDKPEGERGLYLHPEALGHPKNLGLDYQRDAPLVERLEAEEPPIR